MLLKCLKDDNNNNNNDSMKKNKYNYNFNDKHLYNNDLMKNNNLVIPTIEE
jgi:hypothetical protein